MTVKQGEKIVLPAGFPIADQEFIVKANHRDEPEGHNGQWACVTHKLIHKNNLSASIHEESPGRHLVVWLCNEHGPEVP